VADGEEILHYWGATPENNAMNHNFNEMLLCCDEYKKWDAAKQEKDINTCASSEQIRLSLPLLLSQLKTERRPHHTEVWINDAGKQVTELSSSVHIRLTHSCVQHKAKMQAVLKKKPLIWFRTCWDGFRGLSCKMWA